MTNVNVINKSDNALPEYQTEGAAGLDLRANLVGERTAVQLLPLQRELIPTGLYMELPKGHEAQVRPRSGLAFKQGVTVLNSPGTIDADYRGEVKVLLVNLSDKPVLVEHGERIAQMVVSRHEQIAWNPVESLEESARGEGGFGSSGIK